MSDVFWAAFGGGAAAGIFSLIALGFVEWLRWFIDRPMLHVYMNWRYQLDNPTKVDIGIEAINPHKRSVTLSSFGIALKGKGKLEENLIMWEPIPYKLPYELDGGKSISETFELNKVFNALKSVNKTPYDLNYAWFKTQTGNIYRSKRFGKKEYLNINNKYDLWNQNME